MPKRAPDLCEDVAYTKQFFTITRKGHTHPTADFGAPTMVWHIAFWPRREMDPHDIDMIDPATGDIKNSDAIRTNYSEKLANVTRDFDDFLRKLQRRGRVPSAIQDEPIFVPGQPLDWVRRVPNDEPFDEINMEATGFTLWWRDNAPPSGNMMDTSEDGLPTETDIRVRVQAELHSDYSTVTFFIDAGKPWNAEPVYLLADAKGARRRRIFQHISNIKSICEPRIEGIDVHARRYIDLPLLPETDPISPTTVGKLEGHYSSSAHALSAAGDYLYKDLWEEFCNDFEFNLCDIAGRTDEVFANFRGLVMSTSGKSVPLIDPTGLARSASPGSEPFSRFAGDTDGYGSLATEPNAVVKAFMPFMRRFRPEADARDWIASGIFDWRGLYLTSLGAQSEFRALDESNYDEAKRAPVDIPGGYLPERLVRSSFPGQSPPEALPECKAFRPDAAVPTTLQNDRPAPFRYLLLTKYEPNRKQVGRMIERINTTGARRLYALKNWTIVEQASKWIRVYGLQLDAAYQRWITETDRINRQYAIDMWKPFEDVIAQLPSGDMRAAATTALHSNKISPERACEELEKIVRNGMPPSTSPPSNPLTDFLASQRDVNYENFRKIKEARDLRLAAANQKVERNLIEITSQLDQLGRAAIGGLPYRVSRSRYYAELFRDAVETLRVGNIETWWSYKEFAHRGMEPALRYIANVGERLERLRGRLQGVKQDILQSSIASQTEATRDNTYKLEAIQRELKRMADETHELRKGILSRQYIYWGAAIFGTFIVTILKILKLL